jgi:hypothetical protein
MVYQGDFSLQTMELRFELEKLIILNVFDPGQRLQAPDRIGMNYAK